jgi:hypothetical protein
VPVSGLNDSCGIIEACFKKGSRMDDSNNGSFSLTQPIDFDFDASDWYINSNIWDFVPECGQTYDELPSENQQNEAQCLASDQPCESPSFAEQAEQNIPINAWDVLDLETFDIEQILSQVISLPLTRKFEY